MITFRIYVMIAFWLGLATITSTATTNRNGISALLKARSNTNVGTLSVPVSHNIHRVRNFHLEYYKTLAKYNLAIPEQLQKIAAASFKNDQPTSGCK
jgi:hypothetical protein